MRSAILVCAVGLAALPACINVGGRSADVPPDAFHVLDVGAGPEPRGAAPRASDLVLAVRPLEAPHRFDRHVVRIDGPGRITPLEHDLWADEPSAAVTDAVRETITASRAFAAVVDPADAHESHVLLDGSIREFAWAPGTPSRAIVRLRLHWSDVRTGRVTATRLHEATEDLPGPGTDGLGPAMARAVRRAVLEAVDAQRAPRENVVTPPGEAPAVR